MTTTIITEHPGATFYGVGLGPGDPELLTRKAVRVLKEVEAIYFPAEATRTTGFAARMLATLDLPAARLRRVPLAMARDRDADQQTYTHVAAEIAGEVRRGRSVAWATAGDPLFYSTFLPVYAEVRGRFPDVRMEIVPGVSSVHAATARAGVPVAHLDDTVAILPAVYGLERLPELLESFATVVLLKVHSVFDALVDALPGLPHPPETVYLENIGMPGERVVRDLVSLRGQKLPYFSLVLLRRQARRKT